MSDALESLKTLSQLDVELNEGIAVLKMNFPPVNALSRTLIDELTRSLDVIDECHDVRVVVLTGGGRHFCAGADLKGRKDVIQGPGDLSAHSRRNRECYHRVRECSKPVIAAVNGSALGAGLALVASCDILVAADTARLGLPEIDVGLMGGARHAQRLFPHSLLRRMVLTGHRVSGEELYRLGIVEACVPVEGLLPAALEIADDISRKSPLAVRWSKQTLNAIEDMTLRDGYRYEQDMTAAISETEDAKEAQRAFLEKRAPRFVGR